MEQTKTTTLEECDVQAINRSLGQVVTAKNEVCTILGWHNADDDYVDPDIATFVTFQLPNGKYGYAILSDFNDQSISH